MPREFTDRDIELDRLGEIELGHFKRHTQLTGNYVPGEGMAYGASVFIIGEAPGAQEALARRPFFGPCRVLRELMDTAGMDVRTNVWLTNTVKLRPPGNRTPTPEEVAHAKPFLLAEWATVGSPRIIVPVGRVAFEAVMGRQISIMKHAGTMLMRDSKTDRKPLYIWPMLHPAFALRNPTVQPIAERHWCSLGAWFSVSNS